MLSLIREHLGEEARGLGIPIERLTFLKRIGGDLSPEGKALFEILGPDSPLPLWMIKAARTAHGNQRLLQEHQRLKHIFKILPVTSAETSPPLRVPRPVYFEERPNGSLSIETFLTGNRVSQLLQQHNRPDPWEQWKEVSFLAIGGLLTLNQVESRREITIDSRWWERRLIEPLTPYHDYLVSICAGWEPVWEALHKASGWSLSGESVPQHGDFTPANMVLDHGSIGIFDWSPDDPESPPLLDLFQFLASASLYLGQGIEQKTKVTDLSLPLMTDTCFLKTAAPPVFRYLKWWGIETKDLLPLSLASLVSKILTLLQRPVPVLEFLQGWVWITSEWMGERGTERLISFANDEDFA